LRGYLEKEYWEEVNFSIEVFGERHPVHRVSSPIYDPTNQALKT
jgi:4-methylaminobutanoate oxidase (formaldehyde-forming)